MIKIEVKIKKSKFEERQPCNLLTEPLTQLPRICELYTLFFGIFRDFIVIECFVSVIVFVPEMCFQFTLIIPWEILFVWITTARYSKYVEFTNPLIFGYDTIFTHLWSIWPNWRQFFFSKLCLQAFVSKCKVFQQSILPRNRFSEVSFDK